MKTWQQIEKEFDKFEVTIISPDGDTAWVESIAQIKEHKEITHFIRSTLDEYVRELFKDIDYARAHHEDTLANWDEVHSDVFKSKDEVKGFLMALDAIDELLKQHEENLK